jgi:hypothetical protein
MTLNRRRFIEGVSWLLSGSVGLGLTGGCDSGRPGGSPLALALGEHFAYLRIDDEVIDAFVSDFEAAYGRWQPRGGGGPFTRFLASTDFFQNGADESRELRYVRFFDPYASPCYNPFSG